MWKVLPAQTQTFECDFPSERRREIEMSSRRQTIYGSSWAVVHFASGCSCASELDGLLGFAVIWSPSLSSHSTVNSFLSSSVGKTGGSCPLALLEQHGWVTRGRPNYILFVLFHGLSTSYSPSWWGAGLGNYGQCLICPNSKTTPGWKFRVREVSARECSSGLEAVRGELGDSI